LVINSRYNENIIDIKYFNLKIHLEILSNEYIKTPKPKTIRPSFNTAEDHIRTEGNKKTNKVNSLIFEASIKLTYALNTNKHPIKDRKHIKST
tara:strand:- start:227 stop:505 length:279 start_codon:yes stop_codon:yes gene_type:complete